MGDFGMNAAQWSYDRMEPRGGIYGEPEPEPIFEPFEDKWEEETESRMWKEKMECEGEINGQKK